MPGTLPGAAGREIGGDQAYDQLAGIYLAGKRFDRMVKRVMVS